MELEEYEKIINETDISNKSFQFYLDGMSEESGEISGVLKRVRRGDYGSLAQELIEGHDGVLKVLENFPDVKEDLLQEIGDREWYTNRALNRLGLTLGEVLQMNAIKVKRRIDDGTIRGKGDHR
jgi:NTP pyrophosphatase (non-canonical NTP hydrolase)